MDDRVVAAGSDPRRLLVFTDAQLIAGAEQAVAIVVSRLPLCVHVTVIGDKPEIVGWIASHRPGCETVIAPPLSTIRHMRHAPRVRRLIKSCAPTAIHLNKTEVAGLRYPELLCRLMGYDVVSVVHHVEPPVTTVARRLTRVLASMSSAVVAVSTQLAGQLAEILDVTTDRITVIPNAVEPVAFERDADVDRFTIGVLSRFVAHKCLDHILEAAAKVPEANLVIGGSGPMEESLRDQADELGIADRTTFLGWVDPDEVFRRSDIVALASRIEGHPLTLLDAQARGIPAVATDVGGVSDIVVDDETGFVIPFGDIDAMAQAFGRLADDPELVERLGAAARRRAENGYTPDDMAASYLRLYWPCP